MNTLPLHPLLVHIPVVLLPVAALLSLLAFKRRWLPSLMPFLVGSAVIGTIGTFLAASSGEKLLGQLGEHSAILERHEELVSATEALALAYCLAVLLQAALYWSHAPGLTRRYGERLPYPIVTTIVALLGIAALVCVVLTGHAGAQSVWQG